jgi:transposase
MIALSPGARVYLACGITDMRKGAVGLAMLVQQTLAENPFDGALYAFRGRRAGLIKLIWHLHAHEAARARPILLALHHDNRSDLAVPGTIGGVARRV